MPYEKRGEIDSGSTRTLPTQTRIYILIVAFVFCLLLIFIAISTPLIVFKNEDTDYVSTMRRLELELANEVVVPFRQAISNASMLTKAMQGYVISRMTVLPNLNDTPEARISSQGTDYDDFSMVVPAISRDMTYIAMLSLQPGGVYSLMQPMQDSLIGRDVFAPTDYAQEFWPRPQDTLMSGSVANVGPVRSSYPYMKRMWTLTVRRPVYNRTSEREAVDVSTFWGFAMATVNISGILDSNPFHFATARRRRRRVDYLLSTRVTSMSRSVVVATSLRDTNPAAVDEFLRTGTSVAVMPNNDFTITIRGAHYGSRLSPNNVTIVVAAAVAGLLFLFALVVAFMIFYDRPYNMIAHAPKMAPFAMLTVGPCRGEELWELAPDEMADVTDRLGRVLARQMVRHRAYQIQQVHPLTMSYVTRSVAAAVQMAFDTIEELQSAPIDDALRRLLGDDGCLLLSYAVHWCSDAAVRLDAMSSGYRYEGPDVVYGGRMWAFAAPSVVTVSEAVADALPRFGLRCLAAEPYRRVHVVRSRSVCGATGDGAVMNGGGGSTSGAATIYVPYPAPTTVEATAGMGDGRPAVPLRQGRDEALPPRTLLTLIDERRPLLVAAREAAPPLHLHHHGGGGGPPHSASSFPPTPLVGGRGGAANVVMGHLALEHTSSSVTIATRDTDLANASASPGGSGSDSSQSEDGESVVTEAIVGPVAVHPFASLTSDIGHSNLGTGAMLRSSQVIQGDGVTRVLLRPDIPHALDVALHVAFDYQAITLGMTYDSARVLVYYFYSSYKILFRPLAAPERHNIYRRLVTAFGVPQQGILEHLAARCAIRCLQQSAKLRQLGAQRRRANTHETPLPL